MSRDEYLREVLHAVKGDKERVIALPIKLIQLLGGDRDAAILLAQCLHWERFANKDSEGWWCKPKREFESLGFNRWQLERVRARLAPYLEWKLAGFPPKCHYRVNVQSLYHALRQLAQNAPIDNSRKMRHPNGAECANHMAQNAPNERRKMRQLNAQNAPIGVNSDQPQKPRGTDLNSEICTEEIQTPTPRCAASLERLSSSNGGGASADSHIHISDSDLALLAQRYGIRFARQPSPWAAVIIRTVLNGEGGEGHIEILRTLAARGSGDFGGAVAAAPREANTTVGG